MILAIRGRVLRALPALPLLSLPVSVSASGFTLESQGVRAMGLSGACVAQHSDPSAISFNPAGIAFLRGHQLYIAGSLTTLSTDFTGAGPYPAADTLERTSQGLGPLPAVYYSQRIGEAAAIGVGFSKPFGAHNEWEGPDRATGRFTCVVCDLGSWSINPTAAVKLADRFAVGGGIDIRVSQFSLTRRASANPNPFPQLTDVAEITLESNRTPAVGWNVGLLASPSESFSVGLTYRHKVVVSHDATASFTQIPTGNATVDAAVAASLPEPQIATVGFVYPASLAAGASWRDDRWMLEADVVRTLWSAFDNVTLAFRTTSYDQVLPQTFADAWTLALGAELSPRDDWQLRGGYSYDSSAQPDSTLSPFMIDAARHGFSVGGSWKRERLRLDAAFRVVLRASRVTDGANRYGYEGSYSARTSFGFGLAIGYEF
jgi:long-chain fatty acid transport protein